MNPYSPLRISQFHWLLLLVIVLLSGCGQTVNAPWESRSGGNYSSYGAIRGSSYVVRRGDTLSGISRRSNVRVDALARENRLKSPYSLAVGQKLVIPGSDGKTASQSSSKASKSQKVTKTEAKKTASSKSSSTQKKSTQKKSTQKQKKSVVPAAKPSSSSKVSGGVRWQWPTKGKLASTFSPSDPARRGIKIAGRVGQPIYSAASGKVVYSGDGLVGYGELIIIKHNDNYLSAYGQNRKRLVKEGDSVKRGTKIAEMGEFGDKTVLHFEIRKRGKPVNPVVYLPK